MLAGARGRLSLLQCSYSTDYGWGLFREKESVKNSERYHRTYTWNEKNQLVSTSDAQYTVNYVYGQDGQRAAKYTAQSETLYFNKMWTLHTNGGNSHLGGEYAKNVYLGETRIVTKLVSANEIRAWEEVNKIYFYHSDHLGSASLITDENGNEYQRLEYTPYGEVWVDKYSQIQESTALLPYKFTGKERDEETGLYYFGARYLDAKYSRWISTDPALGEYIPKAGKGTADEAGKLPGIGGAFNSVNLNLYHYAGNNPVKYTDPDGKTTRDDFAYQLRTEGKKDDALRMECRAASAQGENIAGIITIYSSKGNNYDPYSGSIMFGNHSWLSFEDTTEANSIIYYGTWGKGNKGLRENTYYEVNWQDNYPDVAKRSVPITKEQKEKLEKYVAESKKKGDKAWSHLNPCSAWASKGWEKITGEKLKHRGLIISDPNVLHKSIEGKNEQ